MAPLPPHTTARLFVDYQVAGFTHTAMVRYDPPNTAQDAYDTFADLVTALGTQLFASTLISARFAVQGADVTVPFVPTGVDTWGSGAAAGDETAHFYDFIGRSAGGRRVRVTIFGAVTVAFNNIFRVVGADASEYEAALEVVKLAEGTLLAIDGSPAFWANYINTGINAYWRNHIR